VNFGRDGIFSMGSIFPGLLYILPNLGATINKVISNLLCVVVLDRYVGMAGPVWGKFPFLGVITFFIFIALEKSFLGPKSQLGTRTYPLSSQHVLCFGQCIHIPGWVIFYFHTITGENFLAVDA